MHHLNRNYHQDLLSEADQLSHLPQLSALLDNPWFKHFIATWLQDMESAREAVCSFPVKDMSQLITMIQTRGEANILNSIVNFPYTKYNELIEEVKENERSSSRT